MKTFIVIFSNSSFLNQSYKSNTHSLPYDKKKHMQMHTYVGVLRRVQR